MQLRAGRISLSDLLCGAAITLLTSSWSCSSGCPAGGPKEGDDCESDGLVCKVEFLHGDCIYPPPYAETYEAVCIHERWQYRTVGPDCRTQPLSPPVRGGTGGVGGSDNAGRAGVGGQRPNRDLDAGDSDAEP
jgi:hypothetical protein